MRKSALAASALVAVLAAPAAAAGTTGPFAGIVTAGSSNTHHYDNNPKNTPCIQLATTYTVTLTYAPPTDVVSMSVGGVTVNGVGGVAAATIWGSICTRFTITVTGTSVGATGAPYAVTVTRGMPGVVIE